MDIHFVMVYRILFHASVIVLCQLQYTVDRETILLYLILFGFIGSFTKCEFKAKLIDESKVW